MSLWYQSQKIGSKKKINKTAERQEPPSLAKPLLRKGGRIYLSNSQTPCTDEVGQS